MGWTPTPWGLFKLLCFYTAWVLSPGLPILAIALGILRRDFRLLVLLVTHTAYRQARAERAAASWQHAE